MTQPPALRILLAKRPDGGAVLRCLRRDGSETWQKHEGAKARFFPFHDLTHYAVESELPALRGFYTLVAEGWDIADTEGKGPRGKSPSESILVEHVVGLLERERVGGAAPLSADAFREEIARMSGRDAPELSEGDLARLRARVETLHRSWAELPESATLELAFDPSDARR
jgi:hypothetical protein